MHIGTPASERTKTLQGAADPAVGEESHKRKAPTVNEQVDLG
jgi:hypothetical protein